MITRAWSRGAFQLMSWIPGTSRHRRCLSFRRASNSSSKSVSGFEARARRGLNSSKKLSRSLRASKVIARWALPTSGASGRSPFWRRSFCSIPRAKAEIGNLVFGDWKLIERIALPIAIGNVMVVGFTQESEKLVM